MDRHLAKLGLALLLAFGVAAGAQAQGKRDSAVLPIVDDASGKVHSYLVLEPTADSRADSLWRPGAGSLDTVFGLEAGSSLGLVCTQGSSLGNAINSLANNCRVAELVDGSANRRASATAALDRGGGRFGVTVGEGRSSLPAWLNRGNASRHADVDVNDLTVFVQRNVGKTGVVSIAGTVAKATLIPFAEAPADIGDRWDSKSLSVGGGYGAFSANIIGRVIDTPGQPKFEGLGLGVSWRTPWSGQLTVGADNIVTRGKNPFSPNAGNLDEGTVPYVRYEQDL